MKITKGVPTKPGWYWIRMPEKYRDADFEEREWEIRYLRNYGGEIAIENTILTGWDRFEQAEYYGPLEPPKPDTGIVESAYQFFRELEEIDGFEEHYDPKAVRFKGCTEDQIRWGSNDDPNGLLTPGEVYEVEKIDVHTWHTKYILKGFPGRVFNSVCFEEVTK